MLRAPERADVRDPTWHPSAVLGLAGLLAAIWPFILSFFGKGNVYALMGPFALLVIAAAALVVRKERLRLVARRTWLRDLGIGVAVGVGMTAATYGAYAVAARLVPGLAGHVTSLYSAASTERVEIALAWTAVVAVAEELLWRGPFLDLAAHRFGRRAAVAFFLATYTLAQLGSGSIIVMLAALICGAIWSIERITTHSIVAPIVSHLIWTLVVIHLIPVTRFG
jgi:membrane protease YdiL (CAAX protease family)